MTDEVIKAALREAAKAFCVCDGECFETRHGMMNGPCEAMTGQAAAAIEAFLRALRPHSQHRIPVGQPLHWMTLEELAAAVRLAAQEPTQTCGGNTQSAAQEDSHE